MGFSDAVRTCFSKYVTFSGRAARPEYWYFVLFVVIGVVVLSIIDGVIFGADATGQSRKVLSGLFQLATFLPLLAAGWRRMHDTGRPGYLLLLPFVVAVGSFIVLFSGMIAVGGGIQPGGDLTPAGVGPAALFGLGGMAVIGFIQLALLILMIWWLTRPTEPQTNAWGPPPM